MFKNRCSYLTTQNEIQIVLHFIGSIKDKILYMLQFSHVNILFRGLHGVCKHVHHYHLSLYIYSRVRQPKSLILLQQTWWEWMSFKQETISCTEIRETLKVTSISWTNSGIRYMAILEYYQLLHVKPVSCHPHTHHKLQSRTLQPPVPSSNSQPSTWLPPNPTMDLDIDIKIKLTGGHLW